MWTSSQLACTVLLISLQVKCNLAIQLGKNNLDWYGYSNFLSQSEKSSTPTDTQQQLTTNSFTTSISNNTNNTNLNNVSSSFSPASSMFLGQVPSGTPNSSGQAPGQTPTCRKESCPAAYINGCCHKVVRQKLESWLNDLSTPGHLKQIVKHGTYGQLEPSDVGIVPLFILQRLDKEGAQWFSTSQMRALLSKHPNEVVTMANLLRYMRPDYFDVFLMNLKIDVERGIIPYANVSSQMQKGVVWAARTQWGPFQTWKEAQLKISSQWIGSLPCFSFYVFNEQILINSILPVIILAPKSLDDCSRQALFNRVSRASQMTNINSWDIERTITFASLLTAAPPQVLSTLPQATVQHPRVIESLTRQDLQRCQVEAIMVAFRNLIISSEMLLSMSGTDGNGKLLKYFPPWLLDSQVPPNVFAEAKTSTVLKTVFCRDDPERAFKTGYQIYWMYRRSSPSREWSRKDIEELGCLSRYMAPLDMARLDLLEMAKDIETSYTNTFENGDYSYIQAKILFNYGRQLLHLGSGSWVAERFAAIPISVVPGVPVQKISEFPWEEISKETVISRFCKASSSKLGLNKAQTAILLRKLNTVHNGGMTSVIKATSLVTCKKLIQFVPYISMRYWNPQDIFSTQKIPQLTSAQAHYWLRRSLSSNIEYATVRTLTKFLHGLDCDLISKVDLFETTSLLTAIQDGSVEITPETARCLKILLFDYLQSLSDDQQQVVGNFSRSSNSAIKNYWPALISLAGSAVNLQLNSNEIRDLSPDICKVAISVATDMHSPRKFQRSLRPRGRRENFVRSAISCIESESRDLFQLGMAESVILKYAMSELPGDYYFKIPDEIVFQNLHYMQGGCLSSSQRRGLRSKLMSTLGAPEHWQQEDISHLSCLIYELEQNEFDRIPDLALVNYVQSLGQCWDDRNTETRHFRQQCEQELGHWESLQLRERIQRVNLRLALLAKDSTLVNVYNTYKQYSRNNGYFNVDQQPAINQWNSFSGIINDAPGSWPDYSRMKMLTEPLLKDQAPIIDYVQGLYLNMTCDWFMAAGPHVVSMPYDTFVQPINMSSAEFIRCIPSFADYDWPILTRDALWERIKQEIGFPSPPELETMGYILLSLQEDELRLLDFSSSLDLLHAFGSLEDWSDVQLQTLAHRFRMTVTPIMENLDAVQLVAMGSILCGFSQSEIEKVNVEAYIESSVAVGTLRRCSIAALRGLATLATRPTAYGPSTEWTSATLSTVGIVTAGLSAPELSKIPARSLNGLACSAVAMMSPLQFQAFTLEQLEYFSMEGAMCVGREHVQLLNEAQRFAVWEAGSDAFRIINGAEAKCPLFTFSMALFVLMAFRFSR